MALNVQCTDPAGLLEAIRKAIRERDVDTWLMDKDGDFTHSPEQWRYKAWLRPRVRDEFLVLNILGRKNEKMSKTIYAVYHGRFAEMLLTHFDGEFNRVSATALPTAGDSV